MAKGKTVVPERAPRRAKRIAEDADDAGKKAARDARGARVSFCFPSALSASSRARLPHSQTHAKCYPGSRCTRRSPI